MDYYSSANINILKQFEKIELSEMHKVTLLNRFDRKFWLNITELELIVTGLTEDYFILDIDGSLSQKYLNVYYDTPNNKYYLQHHNNRAKRIKIRKRVYLNSDLAFLEIKFRNNRSKTEKARFKINEVNMHISAEEIDFLNRKEIDINEALFVSQRNTFERITLVSKKLNERCTIDINLTFKDMDDTEKCLHNYVIVELKNSSRHGESKFADLLKKYRIQEKRFSKYCIGRALMEKDLKKNRFKQKILEIGKKYTNQNNHLFITKTA